MTAGVETPLPALPAGALEKPGLRQAFRTLLDHLGDHLELLRIETTQELSRLGRQAGYWLLLTQLLQLVLLFGFTLLVASLWDTAYRTHAILAAGGVLLLALLSCGWQLHRLAAGAKQRFNVSSQQWHRDIELIRELI